jgi:APA family basic amino acid/polyamine antiporter
LFTEEAPVNVGAVAIVAVLGVIAAVGVKESA